MVYYFYNLNKGDHMRDFLIKETLKALQQVERTKAFIKDLERKTKHICPIERELRKLKALNS